MNFNNINLEELKEEISSIIDGKKVIVKNKAIINYNKIPKKELDALIEKSILMSDVETLKSIHESSVSNLYKCRIGKNKEHVMIFVVKNQNPIVYEYFLSINGLNSLMNTPSQKGELAIKLLFEKDSPELFKLFIEKNKNFNFGERTIGNNILEYMFSNEYLFKEKDLNALKNKAVNGLVRSMSSDDLKLCLKFLKNKINKKEVSENVLLSDNVELLKILLKDNMFDFAFIPGSGTMIDFLIEKNSWNMFNVFYKSEVYKNDFILNLNNKKLNKFFALNSNTINNLKKIANLILKDDLIKENDTIGFLDLDIDYYKSYSVKPLNILKIINEYEKSLFPYYVKMNGSNLKKFENKLYLTGEELNKYKVKFEKYKILINVVKEEPKISKLNDANLQKRRL